MEEDTEVVTVYLWPGFNVRDVHPESDLHSISQKLSRLLRSATQFQRQKLKYVYLQLMKTCRCTNVCVNVLGLAQLDLVVLFS